MVILSIESEGRKMTITAIKARNQKYLGKTFDITEVEKDNRYEITIGRNVYHCFVDHSKWLNHTPYKTLKEMSLKTGIQFYKNDSEKSSPVWFDQFSIQN